ALRAHHLRPGRRLGHRQLRPVGRRAGQAAGPAGHPRRRRRRGRPRGPGPVDPGADPLLPGAPHPL
ncbi:MAG: Glucose-6-phosphate isomerase, partial [uncultured Friedmanniella sp.]